MHFIQMIDARQINLDFLELNKEEIAYFSPKGNYSIVSEHIEGPVFRTIMKGIPYYEDALRHNAVGELILKRIKEKGYDGKVYFIVDTKDLKTVTSDARKLFLEFMTIENFGGLIVHGMNFFTSTAIKITKALLPFKQYYLVNNEQKGLEKVRELIAKEIKKEIKAFEEELKSALQNSNLFSAGNFFYSSDSGNYTVETWFIAPDIFLIVPRGFANEDDAEKFSKLFDDFVNTQISQGKKYYRIQLYSFMTGADVKARRFFVDWMKKNIGNMHLAIFISSNRIMRTIVRFGLSMYPKSKKIKLNEDLESSFLRIIKHKEGGEWESYEANKNLFDSDYSNISIPPNEEEKTSLIEQLIDENILLKEKYKQNAAVLFETVGRMSWDKSFEWQELEVFENDPFYEVHNAVKMVHSDLKQMLEDNQTYVKELSNHKENLEKIVEQRTRELELARKKAVESDQLKSAFLANMSHEIRSPMNSIVGFADLLSEPDLEEEQKADFIRLINSSSDLLMRLIEDIIDIAKIEAGQLKIKKTRFKINTLMQKLEETFTAQNNKTYRKPIKLILANENSEDFVLFSDKLRLQQVLSNLLNNAYKFTKEGFVEFGYKVYSNSVYFYVKDSGIGIGPEQQSLVFERFRQFESPNTNNLTGTGLGLAISKSLIEMMGGSINLISELNKGSVFSFTLPIEKDEIDAQIILDEQINLPKIFFNWDNKKVLIAEDIDANFRFLSEVLAKTKIKIYRAKNGIEALNIFKNINPDIVLMDIQMPEMNGYEAFDKIRRINNKTPIIAQTAYAMIEEKEKILDYGFSDYLAKPINSKDLISMMANYL
ncbi:MAG: response regulator [Bacteroidales bacterium]|nr:response regulator [Bacteroidales bacterium]